MDDTAPSRQWWTRRRRKAVDGRVRAKRQGTEQDSPVGCACVYGGACEAPGTDKDRTVLVGTNLARHDGHGEDSAGGHRTE